MRNQYANELIDFIYESPTAYNAVETLKSYLTKEGFKELNSADRWKLEKNGKYFVTKNGSGLVAFRVATTNLAQDGFKLIGAHTDAPGFRIKPNPDMKVEKNYVKLNTEVYGGPILNTWFDRPLGLAGRVTLASENPLKPISKVININKPIMIIPNVAIHMNREINNGVKINAQKDTMPLLALINNQLEKENYLLSILAEHMDVKIEDILDFELMPYEYQKGSIIGLNEEFISTGRLDNLAMIQAGTKALVESDVKNGVAVMLCYDNEEVGSRTKQGADSPFFTEVLERINLSLSGDREDFFRAISNSFLISADLAHALHPNAVEKHDPVVKPLMGKGPVIKIAASQSYSTDSESAAIYEMICKKAGVRVQRFVNRSDVRGGSTIGPIASSHLAVRTVDMGTAVLAMHSIRELGSVDDHYNVIKSFIEFYSL